MVGQPRLSFMEAVSKAINGITDYNTRSRRSELWFWVLFDFLVSFVIILILGLININILTKIGSAIVSIASFVVALPLAIRRLHDIGKSGWYILIGLIPIVGAFILLYLYIKDSQMESNDYGPSPKYSNSIGMTSSNMI